MQKVALKIAYVVSIPVPLNETGPGQEHEKWGESNLDRAKSGARGGPHLQKAKSSFTWPDFVQVIWESLVRRLYWRGRKQ